MERLVDSSRFLATRSSLLLRLRESGDDGSWQQFYDLYADLIYSAALKAGLLPPDAEDVVQETLLTTLRDLHRYDKTRGSFKNWLMHITRFRIADRYRLLNRQRRVEADAGPNDSSLEDRADPAALLPDQAWELAWKENISEMALAELKQTTSAQTYQYFHCCVVEGMKPAEVARILKVSKTPVYLAKSRLLKTYREIIARLEKEGSAPNLPQFQLKTKKSK